MDLTNNISLESLEQALRNLPAPGSGAVLEILTTPPRPTPFCVEAMTLQFIVSAARHSGGTLVARFADLEQSRAQFDASLRKGFGNPHVLIAWVMAQTIQDMTGAVIEKAKATHFNSYLDAMESYDFMRTHDTAELRANLICVQRAQREYVRSLYAQAGATSALRPYGEIRLVVQDILSQLAPQWNGQKLRDAASPLASLVRELMENADWWARTDVNGVPYKSGVRAVTFRLVELDSGNLGVFGGANHHLQAYLQQMLGNTAVRLHGERPRRTFIEMSVVDSGPGLARRWMASQENEQTGTDPLTYTSMDLERSAIAECFKKWRTSSSDTNRGIGLFSVARVLRERNGFLRLRTGRLSYLFGTQSAIRDVEDRAKEKVRTDDYALLGDGTHVFFDGDDVTFFLRPWNDERCAPVEGTAYSILLPA
ncbi:MAG TPA: hypothetical protein VHC91_14530 [Trinickia sp.]|uniref:hypothetical protein n=1 Tax=Trinickia sp. TaxID=2571163 RepID=UPI002CB234AF|nr:hypothetical protein [Trinickia sp.]HVW51590.1 hypothetical protein [Trinickia sp.]